ncbi:MAG: hypothetical protein WCV62_00735 [Candidatus Peribacteraceae bacterium]
MNRADRRDEFCRQLWGWFKRHKRTLPWRDLKVKDQTQRAYMVLVSEVMLQQTQVPRVEIIFRRFLREFPTIHDLAKATNREVILAWRGLGYNSRALRLRDAARLIMDSFLVVRPFLVSRSQAAERKTNNVQSKNVFPRTMKELTGIPGIGPYTAAAILNFAFNIPTPCLDTNIRRIIHRVFYGPERRDGTFEKKDHLLLALASDLLLASDSSAASSVSSASSQWHAALMDFGSLVCTKRLPKCGSCPLGRNNLCRSTGRIKITRDVRKAKEPGREIAGKFVPNRIIRGRVVEYLRDRHGASISDIGAHVCIDWDVEEHREWLTGILVKLARDGMIRSVRGTYTLT